ncbi:MAG: hypothetical protein JOZ77_08945 [Candidatus Eremiobacteraeota bacterium]|nr:hypothetical protein [Candidatus Eremiobacteraeota bacterium]
MDSNNERSRIFDFVTAYLDQLAHLTSFVWLCIFPIGGSLLLAIVLNGGVSEGSELLAIYQSGASWGHFVTTVAAAAYCFGAVALAASLAVRTQGKQPGVGDLISLWVLLVIALALAPIVVSYQRPSLATASHLGPLLAAYGVLFFLLPLAATRWKNHIVQARAAILPGNNLVITFAAFLALGAAVMIAVILAPVAVPRMLGTIAIVAVAIGFWTLLATFVLVIIPRHYRLPTFTLFAVAVVLLFEHWNDDRFIRVCEGTTSASCTPGVEPPDPAAVHTAWPLDRDAVEEWMRNACPRPGPCPMIFVAGEGGGLRAAYWTASVLSALNDITKGSFYRHLFAISTVSGSSIGATAFVALNSSVTGYSYRSQSDALHEFVHQDYLSPIIAAFVFPEVLQRFWPVPIPAFDRAKPFELSLEETWRHQFKNDALSQDFLNLYAGAGGPHMPSLFLNSTNVELGKRFIVSNRLPDFRSDAYYAYDPTALYHITKLPVSTAMHLTARFTYVSPAGVVPMGAGSASNGLPWGRLVDGGYFENTGAATLVDVISSVQKALHGAPRGADARIYVLLVLNNPDPGVPNTEQGGIPSPPPRPRGTPYAHGRAVEQKTTPYSDYMAPIETLFATQGARGFGDRYQLAAAATASACGGFVSTAFSSIATNTLAAQNRARAHRLQLPNDCGGYWEISYPVIAETLGGTSAATATDFVKPALGWILSDSSTCRMDDAAQNIDRAMPDHPVARLRAALAESDGTNQR